MRPGRADLVGDSVVIGTGGLEALDEFFDEVGVEGHDAVDLEVAVLVGFNLHVGEGSTAHVGVHDSLGSALEVFGNLVVHVFLEVLDESLGLGVDFLGEVDTGVLVGLFHGNLFVGGNTDTHTGRHVVLQVLLLEHLHFNELAGRLFLRGRATTDHEECCECGNDQLLHSKLLVVVVFPKMG